MRKAYDVFYKIFSFVMKHMLSSIALIMIILTLITCITNFDFVKSVFTYPEEDYKKLAIEAERMISERSFETEYDCSFNGSKTDGIYEFTIILEKDFAKVKIKGNNYGGPDEVIEIVNYGYEKNEYIGNVSLLYILVLIFLSVGVYVGLIVVFAILWYLLGYICSKITK